MPNYYCISNIALKLVSILKTRVTDVINKKYREANYFRYMHNYLLIVSIQYYFDLYFLIIAFNLK